MELLYTDARIVVCLKPAGVLSTDEPGGMPELLRRALGEPETGCVRTVHRLDRPVGGVMVFARSRMADSLLSRQVQAHTFQKDYLAVLEGVPAQASGVLEDQLRRDTAARRTCVADAPGLDTRPARLSYRVLGEEDGRALVLIRLETGRTHQIRAQFRHAGCPLLGDGKYGREKDNRAYGEKGQALCSWRLRFVFDTPAGALEYLNGKSFRTKTPEFVEKYFPTFAERMKT